MDYIPHTDEEIESMMKAVGVSSLDDLFDTVPKSILLDDDRARAILGSGSLPVNGMAEIELKAHMADLAAGNRVYRSIFQGAGSYWHFIPATVDYVASRGEYFTSYTPYQAERSQGYLQATFEYQSMIAALAGMRYSNASLHDGATALVDAVIMAWSQNKRRRTVLIVGQANPIYLSTAKTALAPRNLVFREAKPEDVAQAIDEDTMAVVVCNPDFFGTVLDVTKIVNAVKARDKGIITIQCTTEALSLALLRPPGTAGVDILVGEAQSLGIPMCFGGPALGLIAVSDNKLLHKMPGRIVGVTKELDGDRYGFTLTLTAREQHIRREKALSNICSNEALNMLRAAVYMASLGSTGMRQVAEINVKKANYLKDKLRDVTGFSCINKGPTFNEFAIQVDGGAATSRRVIRACEASDMLGPLDLGTLDPRWAGMLLFCVTEMNDTKAIDELHEICRGVHVR
ncbi:MAG: aminomethyl-transferring glycine dehydrogenase subunit GcvPA [Candidatus Lokiarchaeota archaeon]|nr:aminomethyl-transferring glycine dehydrogenase subunit GcvPA [Candidatus Lokiarchaeota archaeon]